jgi:outer membrane protein
MKKVLKTVLISSGFGALFLSASAQTQRAPDTLTNATLQACVQYALKHYPLMQQALLDEQITDREIKSKLADWYPQIGVNAGYTNYFQLPVVAFAGQYVNSGTYNNSAIAASLTQNIFTRDVLLASKTKRDVMTNIKQSTETDKIDVTVNVSKA